MRAASATDKMRDFKAVEIYSECIGIYYIVSGLRLKISYNYASRNAKNK